MKFTFFALSASAVLLVCADEPLGAQVCLGNPVRGGVSYVNGRASVAKSNGGGLSYAPGRFAVGIDARAISSPPDEDGFGGTLRLSLVAGRNWKVCPTLAVGADRLVWDTQSDAKVTTTGGVGRAGVGVGYDIRPQRTFGIAPFFIAEFVERANWYKTEASNSESTDTGDDEGKAEATYGVMAHVSRVFAGASASRTSAKGKPDERHLFAGISF